MLAVGPQMDALLQVVHRIDQVHPVFVDHPQGDHTLHLTHDVLGVGGLLALIGLHGLGKEDLLQVSGLQLRIGKDHGALGEVDVLKMAQQRCQLGLIGDAALLGGNIGDMAGHHLAQVVQHGLPQVLTAEHLLALAVDDLSLGVHHVVVLQNVLSGPEIPGFHALLGVLHGAGEDLLIDGGVLIQA